METQDITLSLPKEIFLSFERIAIRRKISVSGLITKALETLIEQEDAFTNAQRRHLRWLEEGFDLGASGQAMTQQNELHKRP